MGKGAYFLLCLEGSGTFQFAAKAGVLRVIYKNSISGMLEL